jgi:molecular chaperone DnaJ
MAAVRAAAIRIRLRLHVRHFRDVLRRCTGGGAAVARSGGRERGADLRYNMEMALEDAFSGKTASIRVPTSIACEACSGTGAKPGTKPTACSTCGGHGRVRANQGFFSVERTCPTCAGPRQMIEDPCPNCPAPAASRVSARSRSTFRRASRTAPAFGLPMRAKPACAADRRAISTSSSRSSRTIFQRDGADLFCRVPISMPDLGRARRRDRGADARPATQARSRFPRAPRPASSSASRARA